MSDLQHVTEVPKLPPRISDSHKGTFGKLFVVAGSVGMAGAAVLCARAAMRSGVGLVRVGLPEPLVATFPLSVPEAMTFLAIPGDIKKQLGDADAVVIGPGLSTNAPTMALVQAVLNHSTVPILIDADALNVLAPLTKELSCQAPLVLTPHPGEAARLLDTTTALVQADRKAAITALCQQSGALVVLKGKGTLVSDGHRCFETGTGNPGMASGGSGDVLSGLLGALLARGLDPFDAACLAVHVHGRAGDRARDTLGENGMVASDIVDAIAQELR
jgi:NAD(P)H-hydrate epimerase